MRDDYDKRADRKIILGPLFKYAAIGITIGVVMLTGIVTLERHNNTLDKDLADLKTELARANNESLGSSTTASTGAESEQVASSQTETPATEPSMQASSITNLISGETEIHGATPITSIPASVKDKPLAADQPVTAEKKSLDESQAEPAIVTNLPVTVVQPVTTEIRDKAVISDTSHALTLTAPDIESFEYEQPEHLSHKEWLEQQRLRREQWLEKVEQRRRDEFGTRKASHANHQLNTVDNRHESI